MSKEAMNLLTMTDEDLVKHASKQVQALRMALDMIECEKHDRRHVRWAIIDALKEEAEQPAPVQQGWKLVPVEPTKDMWKAVNKLDDEMAAGGYDGKGCSIEQAWDCLLAAAPQPAQQEPVAWKHDCAALLTNNVELWIDRCPHCGKPCTSPPAQRKPLTDEEERKAFVDWCFSVGLMAQSHGLRSESSDCDTAWKAWKARAAHGIKENT